jgi:hypothetical protein
MSEQMEGLLFSFLHDLDLDTALHCCEWEAWYLLTVK